MTPSWHRHGGIRLYNCSRNRSAESVAHFMNMTGDSPAPLPISAEHEAFHDLWARNQAHAPDPHVGPYLQKCTYFIRAGYASAIEHQFSTEEERKTLPYFQETARPGKREWLGLTYFSVEGSDWCLPLYRGDDRGPFTPTDARRLAKVAPYLAKIVSLARKFAAFDAASKLAALEQVSSAAIVIDATGRARQMNAPAQDLLGATSTSSRVVRRPTIPPAIADCSSWFRLLCMRNAAALRPSRRSSSIGMKRLGFWLRRCPSRRSAAICSVPVA